MHTYICKSKVAGGLLVAAALFTLATRGFAGPEAKTVVTPEKPPYDWSGFYLGLNIGGVLNNYEFKGNDRLTDGPHGFFEDVATEDQFYDNLPFEVSGQGALATFFIPDHSNNDGEVMGGAQVGYQHQFGHFVLGIEGVIDRTSTSAENVFRDSATTTFSGQIFNEVEAVTDFEAKRRAETNWMGAVMGKVGYAQGPWLFYFIGGVAWCDVKTTAHDIATTNFFATVSGIQQQPALAREIGTVSSTNIAQDNDTRTGWTAGGGIEVAASKTVSLALEYRHSDFGDETYHYTSHGGIIFPGDTKVNLDSDQVTFKMNLHLNDFFFGHDSDVAGSNVNTGVEQVTLANMASRDAKDKVVQMAPVEEFSWTGFYAGAHVGGIWNNFDFGDYDTLVDIDQQFDEVPIGARAANQITDAVTPAIALPEGSIAFRSPSNNGGGSGGNLDNNSDSGIIGGGQAGYNYQWHHWVFGIEGDFSGSDTSGAERFSQTGLAFVTGTPVLAITQLNTQRTAQANWSASLRGRLGYARGPVMLYATGGATWTDVEVWNNDSAFTQFNERDFVLFTDFSQNKQKDEDVVFGATAGGGLEWAFTKIASMALEYRHNWYDDNSFSFNAKNGPIFPGSSRVSLDGDQVTFRVNLLLGHMGHY